MQCWDLQRPKYSTILYDGTGYETESFVAADDRSSSPMETVNDVNGVNGHEQSVSISNTNNNNKNEISSNENGAQQEKEESSISSITINLNDIPMPTENGGYTHTAASRAKIGAANKGKTPWNKGKTRSEEVRARIAAGVRASNRARFLQKVKDMGLTEEEYEAQKREARREKDAEKRARRTAKGGYRPTEETRAKISKILKEKHAKGEIKRSKVDPSKVRRGFTHSEETKTKISESLKKRWATDPAYRERMKTHATKTNSEETRKRISQSLKNKWKDPEFRAEMLEKMSKRERTVEFDESHRKKISEAMKAKWQDQEYREKTLKSIAKRRSVQRNGNTPTRPRKAATKGSSSGESDMSMVQPRQVGDAPRKKTKARKKVIRIAEKGEDVAVARKKKTKGSPKTTTAKRKTARKKKEPDGSVDRLREERRDLFDLLYGDEDFDSDEDQPPPESTPARFDFGDEDLDSFDPYGLQDY